MATKNKYKKRPDGKNDTGRPTVMTSEVVAKLESAFSMGCNDIDACCAAGISKHSLYAYQHKEPDFADRKEILKAKVVLKARALIVDAMNKGDVATAKWVLERLRKDEFGSRSELTGANGAPLKGLVVDLDLVDNMWQQLNVETAETSNETD